MDGRDIELIYLVFDFDLSISRVHLHNTLFHLQKNLWEKFKIENQDLPMEELNKLWEAQLDQNLESLWQALPAAALTPTGGAAIWKEIFTKLLQNPRVCVCIASFNDYKPLVERYMRERVGLTEHQMQRIRIDSWLPSATKSNKNEHLDRLLGTVPIPPIPYQLPKRSDQRIRPEEKMTMAKKLQETEHIMKTDVERKPIRAYNWRNMFLLDDSEDNVKSVNSVLPGHGIMLQRTGANNEYGAEQNPEIAMKFITSLNLGIQFGTHPLHELSVFAEDTPAEQHRPATPAAQSSQPTPSANQDSSKKH